MLSVAEVTKLTKQGLNDEQIGNILGFNKYKIHRFRKANDIPSSKSLKNDKTIKQIKELDGKCANQEELGKMLGLSQSRISKLIIDYQLDITYKSKGKCIICEKDTYRWANYCSDECRKTKEFKCEICGKTYQSTKNNKVCDDDNCKEQRDKLLKQKKKDYDRKREGKKHNAVGSFTEEEFINISLSFFDWKCAYTGEPIKEDLSNCHREHIVPISRGGDNGIWNIVPSLDWVNLSKNDSELECWYKKQPYFSEDRLNKIYEYMNKVSELKLQDTITKSITKNNKEKLTVELVVDLLQKEMTDEQIGNHLGCTTNQIYRFRKANDLPNYKHYKNINQVNRIKSLINRCRTQQELADKLGMSSGGLNKILKKNQLEFNRKPKKFRKRKFGTWTIVKRFDDNTYTCRCDCGFEKVFTQSEIKYNSTKCPECKIINPLRLRKRMFLADYKRAEKLKQKDLSKRGKCYIINSVNDVDEIGVNTYVNLLCPKGHLTKNKFNIYDGCKVCK